MTEWFLNIAAEDVLSEAVLQRLLGEYRSAKKSRRKVRSDLLPAKGTSSKVGPNYNGRLIEFVARIWQPEQARRRAPSLDRTIRALRRFEPQIPRH